MRLRFNWFAICLLSLLAFSSAHALEDPETEVSTAPLGSPYFRHLANDFNLDMREVYKFEKHGFGRIETVEIILISSATQKPLKEYGKRRMKDRVSMKELAAEANLNYDDLAKEAREIKIRIEAKGDQNLPPPVFEVPSPTPSETPKKDKKKKSKEQPQPSPTP